MRDKRVTDKDRWAACRLVTTKTVSVDDLISAIKWAVGEPFSGDCISAKGVPVHARIAQELLDQWPDAGAAPTGSARRCPVNTCAAITPDGFCPTAGRGRRPGRRRRPAAGWDLLQHAAGTVVPGGYRLR